MAFVCQNSGDSSADLPDSDHFAKSDSIGWVSGAMDNVLGHAEGDEAKRAASRIYSAIKAFLKRPTEKGLRDLYAQLVEVRALDYVNDLVDFVQSGELDRRRLQDLAMWLCRNAPDREPVKAAIALLGAWRNAEGVEAFRPLGTHDEFANFVLVALKNALDDPEPDIWRLAQKLDGWGKITAVESLASTTDPDIKAWLLRHGCANTIMNEYLGFICASAGDLVSALKAQTLDDDLVSGAADIIEALIFGGPAEDMLDYAEGAEAVRLFVAHLASRPIGLRLCRILADICTFVEDDAREWDRQPGWSSADRQGMAASIREVLDRQALARRIAPDLEADDTTAFFNAINLAQYLGMDVWEIYYRRQMRGQASWYFLMQAKDAARIDQVLELARHQLDLAAIATGPTHEIAGHGPNYASYAGHLALDFIVQALRRHPGKGWDLIKVSFKSPLIRNRNMAMMALSEWGYENWPADAEAVLHEALAAEVNDGVKASLRHLMTDHVIPRYGKGDIA